MMDKRVTEGRKATLVERLLFRMIAGMDGDNHLVLLEAELR
jgi:hypothetical protein